jgi:hypothetical protein
MARMPSHGSMALWVVAASALALAVTGDVNVGSGNVMYTGLAPVVEAPARFQQMAAAPPAAPAPIPAVPTVSVSDNYEAATNADDMITKALEHGTLSAAQAKAILAAAKAAASADTAKVGAAKKIVEAAKAAQGDVAKDAAAANADAAKAAAKVAEDEKQLRLDEQAAGPPAAIAQQKQAALNAANQRLAAAMAYAATQTRNMDRALAAETAAKAAEEARVALSDAKIKTDEAEVAARNLADVSQGIPSPTKGFTSHHRKGKDDNIGEKVGIALFFLLLVAALLYWWFTFGRPSQSREMQQDMPPAATYGSMGGYGRQDTTV